MATITTFAYDAVGGVPNYTSGNIADWLYQLTFRANGVMPGSDLGLAVSTDGTGNALVQNGVCSMQGRSATLTAGPQSVAMAPLPANGFRTSYAIVMRFDTATQTTAIVSIAGSTIANPGPAVNPSINALTDILLAYVLAVNTGSIAYTVTDARTFTNTGTFAPTASIAYSASDLNINSVIIAPITANATIDITAGSIYKGTRLFIKNTTVGGYTLTVHYSGSLGDILLTTGLWATFVWDGSVWINITNYVPIVQSSTSPISIGSATPDTQYLLTTGASLFTINLPQASLSIGKTYRIIKVDSGAGSIAIVPNGSDVIGQAGNTTIYLNSQFQSISLISSASGAWVILDGQITPDNNGDYALGKLHHLTLNNTTSRQIFSGSISAGFSSAISIGSIGIPSTSKAVRLKLTITNVISNVTNTAAIYLSNNNSNTPSNLTAHPSWALQNQAPTTNIYTIILEAPIISGNFYTYGITSNATLTAIITAIGYYMGD